MTVWINLIQGLDLETHLHTVIKPYSSVSTSSSKGDSLVSHLPYSSISTSLEFRKEVRYPLSSSFENSINIS